MRTEGGYEGRDPERPETLLGASQPDGGSGAPDDTSGGKPGRRDLVYGLTVVVVAAWCIAALAIGMNTAETLWEWLPIFAFGGAAPALFVWQASRILAPRQEPRATPSQKEKENELLGALAARGELTPITAAMRTSLTADEAAKMLEGLAVKGYLQPRVEEGVRAYALREQDLRERPETAPPVSGPFLTGGGAQLLDEPLSERELEVLALVASGRTNSEIASELHVAVGTVKTHTNNTYRKLGVNRRSEALAKARELDLLP